MGLSHGALILSQQFPVRDAAKLLFLSCNKSLYTVCVLFLFFFTLFFLI